MSREMGLFLIFAISSRMRLAHALTQKWPGGLQFQREL